MADTQRATKRQLNLDELDGDVTVLADSTITSIKHNRNAVSGPTGADNFASGYKVGSTWIYGDNIYVCVADGSWHQVYPAIVSGVVSGTGTAEYFPIWDTGGASLKNSRLVETDNGGGRRFYWDSGVDAYGVIRFAIGNDSWVLGTGGNYFTHSSTETVTDNPFGAPRVTATNSSQLQFLSRYSPGVDTVFGTDSSSNFRIKPNSGNVILGESGTGVSANLTFYSDDYIAGNLGFGYDGDFGTTIKLSGAGRVYIGDKARFSSDGSLKLFSNSGEFVSNLVTNDEGDFTINPSNGFDFSSSLGRIKLDGTDGWTQYFSGGPATTWDYFKFGIWSDQTLTSLVFSADGTAVNSYVPLYESGDRVVRGTGTQSYLPMWDSVSGKLVDSYFNHSNPYGDPNFAVISVGSKVFDTFAADFNWYASGETNSFFMGMQSTLWKIGADNVVLLDSKAAKSLTAYSSTALQYRAEYSSGISTDFGTASNGDFEIRPQSGFVSLFAPLKSQAIGVYGNYQGFGYEIFKAGGDEFGLDTPTGTKYAFIFGGTVLSALIGAAGTRFGYDSNNFTAPTFPVEAVASASLQYQSKFDATHYTNFGTTSTHDFNIETTGGGLLKVNGTAVSMVGHTHSYALDDLTDVLAPTPSTDNFFKFNGTNWIPSNIDAADIKTGQLVLGRGGTGSNLAATGGAGQVLQQTTSGGNVTVGTLAIGSTTGTLAVNRGGTGLATWTAANRFIYSTSATAVTTLAAAAGVMLNLAGAAPSWGAVNLASSTFVTGTLPIANGGTNAVTAAAAAINILPAATAGQTLQYNGTAWVAVAAGGGMKKQLLGQYSSFVQSGTTTSVNDTVPGYYNGGSNAVALKWTFNVTTTLNLTSGKRYRVLLYNTNPQGSSSVSQYVGIIVSRSSTVFYSKYGTGTTDVYPGPPTTNTNGNPTETVLEFTANSTGAWTVQIARWDTSSFSNAYAQVWGHIEIQELDTVT